MSVNTRRRPKVKDSDKEAGAGAPAGAARITTICALPECQKKGHTVATCMRNREVYFLSLFSLSQFLIFFLYAHPQTFVKKNRARRFKTATSANLSGRRGWRKPRQSPLLRPNRPSTPPPRLFAKLPRAIFCLFTLLRHQLFRGCSGWTQPMHWRL